MPCGVWLPLLVVVVTPQPASSSMLFRSLRLQRSPVNASGTTIGEIAPHCLRNTGGTCAMYECGQWRGPTDCVNMRCFCPATMCAGSDGICHNTAYINLGTYRIRNVRWPSMYMYLAGWSSGAHVGEDRISSAGQFLIRKLPDGNVLIYGVDYPEHVVTVTHSQDCDSEGDHCTEKWTPTTSHIGGSLGLEMSAVSAASAIEVAPDGQSFMIRSVDYPDRYFYVPRFSWTVDAHKGDPGTGGYWVFDPPVVGLELLPYRGRRCSYDCANSLRAGLHFMMTALALQALSATL